LKFKLLFLYKKHVKKWGNLKHIILFSIERMNENDKEETMKKILKIFFVKRFQKSLELDIMNLAFYERRANNAKYFIVDNGLRRHAIGKKGENYANRLENIVFIELLRRGYSVDVGKLDSKEIDFIARKADEILYVQVAFEIPENTHETDNLLHIKDNYKKILITGKYYEQKEIDGIEVIYYEEK